MSPNSKQKALLNNSHLGQNYAPHLLLQNYHGNGYPPQQVGSPHNKDGQANIAAQASIKTTQGRRKTP